MAKLKTPIAVVSPTIPFENVLIQFNAGGVEVNGDVDLAINVTLIPYRVLPDGTIEQAPPKEHLRYAEGAANKKGNPAMQQLAKDLDKAIEKFLMTLNK